MPLSTIKWDSQLAIHMKLIWKIDLKLATFRAMHCYTPHAIHLIRHASGKLNIKLSASMRSIWHTEKMVRLCVLMWSNVSMRALLIDLNDFSAICQSHHHIKSTTANTLSHTRKRAKITTLQSRSLQKYIVDYCGVKKNLYVLSSLHFCLTLFCSFISESWNLMPDSFAECLSTHTSVNIQLIGFVRAFSS